MRNILESYSPGKNFWDENPQFSTINPFKQFNKSDKSRSKVESSNIMWAIALINHPKSDLYYVSSKEEIVAKNMLSVKDADIDAFWNKHKELCDAFIDMSLTQAEKSLVSWEKRLKQRDAFLSEQVYTFGYVDDNGIEYKDNTKSFDDMQSKTAKFYEEYFKIKKELLEEVTSNKNKKEKSATSDGSI